MKKKYLNWVFHRNKCNRDAGGPLWHPSPNISVMGGQTRVALIASDLMKLTDQAAFTSKGRKF